MGQVHAYLAKLIAQRREHPDDALISHETTVSQIGNCLVTLFQHPDQIRLLRNRPELLSRAIDELLRHSKLTSSILPRIATEDTILGGTLIRAGEAVLPLIATANRDPSAFPDPHRFDITRTGPAHLGLGHRPHYCLGAQLAKARAPDRHRRRVHPIPHATVRDQSRRSGLENRPLDPLRAGTPSHLVTDGALQR
jgi:cytochrome P450